MSLSRRSGMRRPPASFCYGPAAAQLDYRGGVSDDSLRKAVDAAMLPMVKSIGAWGVEEAHWLPDRSGSPVVWLRTRTELERVALQSQWWLLPQVQILLQRLSVPYAMVVRTRLEVTSAEAEAALFDE